jgi:glycosyltransferase involved in cell wall biosynthesis
MASGNSEDQSKVVVAICTYNRCKRLPDLVRALRAQRSSCSFDLLFVDNNSTDSTPLVLRNLAAESGPKLHYVTERDQGIVFARNRAVEECLARGYEAMIVMDDDEMPQPGWIEAALDALFNEGAECVGGRVEVVFTEAKRPAWLGDDLLGFLAAIDYGGGAFWIHDNSTPVWTANVAYRTALFRDGLRFDGRYNREGKAAGGGEDVRMFEALLASKRPLRYRPDMVVEHHVEPWRMRRLYFLQQHYRSGFRTGQFELGAEGPMLLGAPRHLYRLAMRQSIRALARFISGDRSALRQAMNAAHALGMISGCRARR